MTAMWSLMPITNISNLENIEDIRATIYEFGALKHQLYSNDGVKLLKWENCTNTHQVLFCAGSR